MMNSKHNIQFRRNIKEYLSELALLSNSLVDEAQLSELSDVESVREKASALTEKLVSKTVFNFEFKKDRNFQNFIESLFLTNQSEIYIWTHRTDLCGLFKIPSIKKLNIDFPFEINREGILLFLTADYRNRLLLDFSISENGEKILEVEVQGDDWYPVAIGL
jgi:hypothetical protein